MDDATRHCITILAQATGIAAGSPAHPLRQFWSPHELEKHHAALLAVLDAKPSAEVVRLQPKAAAGMVPMLTDLLQRAQSGEVESVALAWIGQQPNYGVWFSDAPGLAMIGAVTDLQHTLLRRLNGLQVGGVVE
jgi:hypothetical protein